MLMAEPLDSGTEGRGLRLRAEDAEDIAVISACLQDSLVPIRDLAYDQDARNFVLVANRFRWEASAIDVINPAFERILCGVSFGAVDGVVYRGFKRNEEDRLLALLAIRSTVSATGVTIDLEFAGEATIRLSAAAIVCHARDFGEPWPTAWQPGHDTDEAT
jgi:DUF2948 family protein